jgi:hypothetical protein
MADPLGMTEAEVAPLFEARGRFADLLDAIEAPADDRSLTRCREDAVSADVVGRDLAVN